MGWLDKTLTKAAKKIAEVQIEHEQNKKIKEIASKYVRDVRGQTQEDHPQRIQRPKEKQKKMTYHEKGKQTKSKMKVWADERRKALGYE